MHGTKNILNNIDDSGRRADRQRRGLSSFRREDKDDGWDTHISETSLSHVQQPITKRRVIVRGPSERLLALYNMGVKKLRKRNNAIHIVAKPRCSQQNGDKNKINLSRDQCNLDCYERLFNLSKERNAIGVERRRKIAQKILHLDEASVCAKRYHTRIQDCVALVERDTNHHEKTENSISSSSFSANNTANHDQDETTEQNVANSDFNNALPENSNRFFKSIDDCIVYDESRDSALSEDSKDHDPNSLGPINWRDSDYSEESSAQTSSSFDSKLSQSSASTTSTQHRTPSNQYLLWDETISVRVPLPEKTTSTQYYPPLRKAIGMRGPSLQNITASIQHPSLQEDFESICSEEIPDSSADARQPHDSYFRSQNDGERSDIDEVFYGEKSSDCNYYSSSCESDMRFDLGELSGELNNFNCQSNTLCYSSRSIDSQLDKEEPPSVIPLCNYHDTLKGFGNPVDAIIRDSTADILKTSLIAFHPGLTSINCKVEEEIEIILITSQGYPYPLAYS